MIWFLVAFQCIALFGYWHLSDWCISHGRWLVVLMHNSRNDIDLITVLARSNKELHDRVAVLEKTLRDHGIYP